MILFILQHYKDVKRMTIISIFSQAIEIYDKR